MGTQSSAIVAKPPGHLYFLMNPQVKQALRPHNRFMAFAFAAADAFIELDCGETMAFVDGTISWLTGRTVEEMTGQSLWDVVAEDDRVLIETALGSPLAQGRFGPIAVKFRHADGRFVQAMVNGLSLPDDQNCAFLSLSAPRIMDSTHGAETITHGAETIKGYVSAAALMRDITAYLRVISVSGTAVSHIEGDQFGLIHEAKLDIDNLKQAIVEHAKENDTTGDGIDVIVSTVALDTGNLSETDNTKALLYSINKFFGTSGEITISQLSDGCQQMLSETKDKIAYTKRIIAAGEFDAYFQPIVDLKTDEVHHYEVLARLHATGPQSSPFHFITFAEEIGMIADFDYAMCCKAVCAAHEMWKNNDHLSIAVNLSARSLNTPRFIDDLYALLADYHPFRDQLLFEVTESWKVKDFDAINNVISDLRKRGHFICIDDFGSGAAAFQYLRSLSVDIVKIDGIYVQEAARTDNGKTFLKSMASLCRDLDILTVGEMVEDDIMAGLLVDAGVDYGQGWLFGKPTAEMKPTCYH